MRRLLRRLAVLASVVGVVMALNVGVAWAVHDGPSPAFENAPAVRPSPSPVGSHLIGSGADGPGGPGAINGLNYEFGVGQDLTNPAVIGLGHNPNCPLHYP